MTMQVLDTNVVFELMVTYQRTIENGSILSVHSPEDECAAGLYTLAQPIPTFEEFLEGNDFAEDELIEESNDVQYLEFVQDLRRTLSAA